MALIFHAILRGNPSNPAAPKRFFVVLKRIGLVKEKQIARQLADETTLNPKEAEFAIEQLKKVLLANLLNGYSVQLGDWGSFHVSVNSEGSDTKEGATADKITRVIIRFLAGEELRNAISKAQFLPYEKLG
jgi:predicted histone-like DNA-binding protein